MSSYLTDPQTLAISTGLGDIFLGIDGVGLYSAAFGDAFGNDDLPLSAGIGHGYCDDDEAEGLLSGDPDAARYLIDVCDVVVAESENVTAVLLDLGAGQHAILAKVAEQGGGWVELHVFGDDPDQADVFDIDNGEIAKR